MDNLIQAVIDCKRELDECQSNKNAEQAHYDADEAIIKFLKDIGYADVAIEYDEVRKWYS